MKELERELMEYLKERNWHKLRPSDIAKSIAIEAGELLEVFQWTDLDIAGTKKDKRRMEALRKELADVLIYCLEMSVLLGLDTKKIIRDKLDAARTKYPAELMRKLQKEAYPGGSGYLEIKERYRRERSAK